MDDAHAESTAPMTCTIRDCAGEYQERRIAQVFTRDGESIVVEDIPARVCDVCGDTILSWVTVERLVKGLETRREPRKFAPVYSFDTVAA